MNNTLAFCTVNLSDNGLILLSECRNIEEGDAQPVCCRVIFSLQAMDLTGVGFLIPAEIIYLLPEKPSFLEAKICWCFPPLSVYIEYPLSFKKDSKTSLLVKYFHVNASAFAVCANTKTTKRIQYDAIWEKGKLKTNIKQAFSSQGLEVI